MIEWLLFGLAQVGAFALGWISTNLVRDSRDGSAFVELQRMREDRDTWCELAKERSATMSEAADQCFVIGRKLQG